MSDFEKYQQDTIVKFWSDVKERGIDESLLRSAMEKSVATIKNKREDRILVGIRQPYYNETGWQIRELREKPGYADTWYYTCFDGWSTGNGNVTLNAWDCRMYIGGLK
jgi:hypothetical protein